MLFRHTTRYGGLSMSIQAKYMFRRVGQRLFFRCDIKNGGRSHIAVYNCGTLNVKDNIQTRQRISCNMTAGSICNTRRIGAKPGISSRTSSKGLTSRTGRTKKRLSISATTKKIGIIQLSPHGAGGSTSVSFLKDMKNKERGSVLLLCL